MEVGFICNDLYDSNCQYTRRDAKILRLYNVYGSKELSFYLSNG